MQAIDMKRKRFSSVGLWALAFLVTIMSLGYQRGTGPTYPVSGIVSAGVEEIRYTFDRSHGGDEDHRVFLPVGNNENLDNLSGILRFKRYKVEEPWSEVLMEWSGGELAAFLPVQPPAGKLEYQVLLQLDDEEILLPGEDPIVIRFKGSVPPAVLVPHIILMFLSMFFGTRAGMEAVRPSGSPRKLVFWTLMLLVTGGMIFGVIVQKYAFGSFWTGFPFGMDLTDNKTLIAVLGWVAALALSEKRFGRAAVVAATLVTWAIFLIPHSMMGSELDYSTIDSETSAVSVNE